MALLSRADKIRDHLANERTFLAWIRTSISIIVFGFVVAKFGITIREFFFFQNHLINGGGSSVSVGVGFMVMGILLAPLSLIRYQMTMRQIESEQFRPASGIALFLGTMTAVFGVILTLYLIYTSQTIF